MKSTKTKNEYISRINNVLDYIHQNIDKELNLNIIAGQANFSPYHFHRIFSGIVGEPLNKFIRRIRLEKSAQMLSSSHDKSITEIAFDCGFSGSATFARAFNDYFGMNASEWREGGDMKFSKNRKMIGKNSESLNKDSKASGGSQYYISSVFNSQINNFIWSVEMNESGLKANVEVKQLEDMTVAYVRNKGLMLVIQNYSHLCLASCSIGQGLVGL